MRPGRKVGAVTLLAAPIVLTGAMLAWFFAMHGSLGFYRVMDSVQAVIDGMAVLGVVLPIIAAALLYMRWNRGGEKSGSSGLLTGAAWTLVCIGIFLPGIMMIGFGVIPTLSAGDKPPLLLVSGRQGTGGVPDMAITYWTENPRADTFRWGETSTDKVISESGGTSSHVFMMRDLQPGRTYTYRINGGKPVTFKAPPVTGKLHFAVSSDPHYGATASRNDLTGKMLAEIADPSNSFDMFFTLGDQVQLGFLDENWQKAMKSMSPVASRIPYRPLPGNHDTLLGGLSLYKRYFFPPGLDQGGGTDLYQRVDLGRVHLFLLDLEWGTESFHADQQAWLERELARVPAGDWKIVLDHCFFYSSGSVLDGWPWYDDTQTIAALTPIFIKGKVDLVLSGHNHEIELLRKSGITYAVTGAFGGKPEPAPTHVSPESIWRTPVHYGLLDVSVDGGRLDLVVRDADFKAIHAITLAKPR
jgi:acid phosphatase type 7